MTSRYGLSDVEWYQILNVFSNTEQIEEVILFGSRAMGTHRPASDIDIAIKGSQLNLSIQHALEWMLDDLLLPYKFDLVIFDKISAPALIRHIEDAGVSLLKKQPAAKATLL